MEEKTESSAQVATYVGQQAVGHMSGGLAKHLNAGTASPEEGNSMLAMITRSLLSAHRIVREGLTEGKQAP